MSYLYKLYDTINIKDSKVGIGTTTPTELLHVEGTVYLNRITNASSNIDMSQTTLSNINVLQTNVLMANTWDDVINVSQTTLSNINIASMNTLKTNDLSVNTITLSNLTSTFSNIDVSTRSLSNITTVSTANLTTDGECIDVSLKSLSNLSTVSLVNLTSDSSHINVSAKSLSNVNSVETEYLTSQGDNINVSGKSLSNITNISVQNITSDASAIFFDSKTLSNITDIYAAGDAIIGGTITASNLNVIGDFTTLNTTTSNTEQMVVTNLGTGPALMVYQTGVGSQFSVAEFYDNESGIALKIADTGLIGIGTDAPSTKMHIYDASSDVETTLEATGTNAARIVMSNAAGITYVGPSSAGTVDIKTTADQPMVFGTSNEERMRIASDGMVGIGTTTVNYALDVHGSAVAFSAPVYVKNGSMNVIQFSHGGESYTSSGNHTLGLRLAWANVTTENRLTFRASVKFHIASSTSVAYRRFESLISPVNNAGNDKPGQLVATEIADTMNSDFTGLTHTVTRHDSHAVDIVISWNAVASNAYGNIQLEVFANQTLGDFTFTPLST